MTRPAESHQVLDLVFSLAATHTATINMVNVHSAGATDLARNKIISNIAEKIKVGFDMLFQFQIRLMEKKISPT